MVTPRDPLLNRTLTVPKEEQVHSNVPTKYRLASRNGQLLLQGAFLTYDELGFIQHEWRDLPTVYLPEPG